MPSDNAPKVGGDQNKYHPASEVVPFANGSLYTAQQPETEKEFKVQPVPDNAAQGAFSAFKAKPGPAIPDNMPGFEGTKEERLAKAKEMNK